MCVNEMHCRITVGRAGDRRDICPCCGRETSGGGAMAGDRIDAPPSAGC